MLRVLLIVFLRYYVEAGVIVLQTASQEDRDSHIIRLQFLQATLPYVPDLFEGQAAVKLRFEKWAKVVELNIDNLIILNYNSR